MANIKITGDFKVLIECGEGDVFQNMMAAALEEHAKLLRGRSVKKNGICGRPGSEIRWHVEIQNTDEGNHEHSAGH